MWPLEKISNWQSGEKYRVEREEFYRRFLLCIKQSREAAIRELEEKIKTARELRVELDRHIEKMQSEREKLLDLTKNLDNGLNEVNDA